MAQLLPLPLTVSCFSKIQIGFTILVPVDPGSPGQRAVKRVCVYRGANRGAFSVNAKRSVCLFFTSSFSQSRVTARVWKHLHLYLQGRLHVISIIINIDKTDADDLLGRSSCVLQAITLSAVIYRLLASETQQLSYMADATPMCYLRRVAKAQPSTNHGRLAAHLAVKI